VPGERKDDELGWKSGVATAAIATAIQTGVPA
jgi:hypothetical protein